MTNNKHNNKHCIEIYEPSDYDGPMPLCATAIDIIAGPDRSEGYLLDLAEPMLVNGEVSNQIVVRPRHDDPIKRVVGSACTVVIYCVKSGIELGAGSEYKYTDVVNWGIGKIRPVENGGP